MTASELKSNKIIEKNGSRTYRTFVDGDMNVNRMVSNDREYLSSPENQLSVCFRLIRFGPLKELQRLIDSYGAPPEIIAFKEEVEIPTIDDPKAKIIQRDEMLRTMRKTIGSITSELNKEVERSKAFGTE